MTAVLGLSLLTLLIHTSFLYQESMNETGSSSTFDGLSLLWSAFHRATSKKVGKGIQEMFLVEMIQKLLQMDAADALETAVHSRQKRPYQNSFSVASSTGCSTLARNSIPVAWRCLDDSIAQTVRQREKHVSNAESLLQRLPNLSQLPTAMFEYDGSSANTQHVIHVVKTATITATVSPRFSIFNA